MSLLRLQLGSVPHCSFQKLLPTLSTNVNIGVKRSSLFVARSVVEVQDQAIAIQRRSANYGPTIWDDNYVQSLKTNVVDETCKKRVKYLKGEVRMMLDQVMDPIHQLELIDVLQRLGLAYHFDNEIDTLLMSMYCNDEYKNEKDLHAAALGFRLLRQHGFNVPQGVFNSFMDENTSNFKANLCEDTNGILSLYEASYLLMEGENIMEKARDFTTQHLEDYVNKNKNKNDDLLTLINHALEFPLHWRVPRVETRWFIDAYEKMHDKNHVLLEFAKLDFNMAQAIHQEDLKEKSRWWSNLGVAKQFTFSRDRLMENFYWTVGFAEEPRFSYFRSMTTEIYALITAVDDLYDVYGTVEELELFTKAIERWDINAMDQLPEYMRLCYFAVFHSSNELAYHVLNKHGIDVIHYLKRSWLHLCQAFLVDAKWYYSGYTPGMEEFLEHGWVSAAVPAVLVHAFFSIDNPITIEGLKALEDYHHLIRYSSLILRLVDDLGNSSDEQKRGDAPKSVQCIMHAKGCSEEEARKHVHDLIKATWSKFNKAALESPFPRDFIRVALNVARTSQHIYQFGDGHASQDQFSKDRMLSLLIQPIPLTSSDANA